MRTIPAKFGEPSYHRYSVIRGEHLANLLVVGVEDIIASWPDAWFAIQFQRPDGYRYPAATGLTAEDGRVYYLLTGTDTAVDGDLRVEVQARNDAGVLAKDHIFVITVEKSMDAPGEVPPALPPTWVDTVVEAEHKTAESATNAKASEEAAKEAQQEAEAARGIAVTKAGEAASSAAAAQTAKNGGIECF